MPSTTRSLTRVGLVGGAALLAIGLCVPSASAASGPLGYSCDFGFGDESGSGTTSAAWDSAIGDGVTVKVGDKVSLDPFTGSITLPAGFATMLRNNETDPFQGGGLTATFIDETGEEYDVDFDFGPTDVNGEGPTTVQVTGAGGDIVPTKAGTHTLVAGDFILFVDTGETGPDAGMSCRLTDEGDAVIDTFTATGTPSPTTSPTVTAEPTASATRPVVVQTDFAGEDPTPGSPLALGGALLAAAGTALVVGRARNRATARRH